MMETQHKAYEDDLEILGFDTMMFKYRGFTGIIVRHNSLGTLCGYVSVPKKHPLYGLDYDTIERRWDIYSHGGLTFSSDSLMSLDKGWYIGFDCAHANDYIPLSGYIYTMDMGIFYRDVTYVKETVQELIDQMIEIAEDNYNDEYITEGEDFYGYDD